ncbi:sulfate ABC transporter permease subunit CysT [Pelagibacterium mangrovi]|uniref:sulfate ABC transporter permease subunit CysT n=1 Tax=Pelagibacterium mangrovi TaxID=3119828 RepID=UPI002FC9BF9D
MAIAARLYRRSILPGFGLSLGIALTYATIIIALPIAAMLFKSASLGFDEFIRITTSQRALSAYWITISSAALATVINAGLGLLLAWVIVRYRFAGRKALDALVDLPFALPTAVAGLTLVTLFSPDGWYGAVLEPLGLYVNYTQIGIIVAMTFTSIPFVVRAIQPVLEQLEPEFEEAARSLGASDFQVFTRVVWPAILPAFLTGCVLSFARSLGEYGAVVFIAGNIPGMTEIVSLLIVIRLDEYNYPAAAALATVLLVVSFVTMLSTNLLQGWQLRYAEKSR